MPATYSINVGQPTESLRKQDINSVMLDLPDNTQKLISPKDVRDAFLTAWANSAFKQTIGQANIEYLGIDSGNPSNRDIKQKIYIGKRNFAGSDIMNSTLLNDTNSDIYIYNTKPDSYSTQSTTIVILSGTDSFLHQRAPYINSDTVNNGSALSLDFVNPSLYAGPINVYSSTGRVAINGIMFPTVAETSASASNGKVLKYFGTYPNGVLRWSDSSVSISSVGSPGSVTNIYGSPSNVNGYSLEFVNNNIVPLSVGGVEQGSSFSTGSFNGQNWPLSEVIRKILYPYVAPSLFLDVKVNNFPYLSTGLTQTSVFSYSLTRYSNAISSYNISGTTFSGLSFSGNVGSSVSGTFSLNLFSNTSVTQSYVLSARDNTVLITFSHSATASIRFVNPMFYGFNSTKVDFFSGSAVTRNSQVGSIINSSTRFTQPYSGPSQSILAPIGSSGYIYFMTPWTDYPLLSLIKDPNGFIIHDSNLVNISAFTYSSQITPTGTVNLPTGLSYRVYRTIATCSYTGNGKFEFIF